jgi:hypothetical protein
MAVAAMMRSSGPTGIFFAASSDDKRAWTASGDDTKGEDRDSQLQSLYKDLSLASLGRRCGAMDAVEQLGSGHGRNSKVLFDVVGHLGL